MNALIACQIVSLIHKWKEMNKCDKTETKNSSFQIQQPVKKRDPT